MVRDSGMDEPMPVFTMTVPKRELGERSSTQVQGRPANCTSLSATQQSTRQTSGVTSRNSCSLQSWGQTPKLGVRACAPPRYLSSATSGRLPPACPCPDPRLSGHQSGWARATLLPPFTILPSLKALSAGTVSFRDSGLQPVDLRGCQSAHIPGGWEEKRPHLGSLENILQEV